MEEIRAQEGLLQQALPDPGAGTEALGLSIVAEVAEDIAAPAGNICSPEKDMVPGPKSDLLHIVSREEALLAV